MTAPSEPLLSICIPTYNRSGCLRQTLESVLASLSGVSAHCELLVSDNASPDDTQAVLAEFRLRWPALKVFRNPENNGELNFYTTIQHATGRYLWLLGDDDLVKPEFLSAVIERLAEEPDLVVCNHSIHSLDFSKTYRQTFHPRSAPERFSTRDDVLATFGIALGFISAAVVRREPIAAIPLQTFERFSACGLSFFVAVCTSLKPDSRVAYIREPLLQYRGGNSPIDWENVFVDGVDACLRHLAGIGDSPRAIRRAKGHTVRRYLIPRIVQLKNDRVSATTLMARSSSVFSRIPEFHLLASPLAAVPPGVFSFLRWLRRRAA